MVLIIMDIIKAPISRVLTFCEPIKIITLPQGLFMTVGFIPLNIIPAYTRGNFQPAPQT